MAFGARLLMTEDGVRISRGIVKLCTVTPIKAEDFCKQLNIT